MITITEQRGRKGEHRLRLFSSFSVEFEAKSVAWTSVGCIIARGGQFRVLTLTLIIPFVFISFITPSLTVTAYVRVQGNPSQEQEGGCVPGNPGAFLAKRRPAIMRSQAQWSWPSWSSLLCSLPCSSFLSFCPSPSCARAQIYCNIFCMFGRESWQLTSLDGSQLSKRGHLNFAAAQNCRDGDRFCKASTIELRESRQGLCARAQCKRASSGCEDGAQRVTLSAGKKEGTEKTGLSRSGRERRRPGDFSLDSLCICSLVKNSIRKTISDLTDTVSPEFISLLIRQYSWKRCL